MTSGAVMELTKGSLVALVRTKPPRSDSGGKYRTVKGSVSVTVAPVHSAERRRDPVAQGR